MLYLLRSKEGACRYLIKDEYSIGRKECDILIENDASISRKHALIKQQNNEVILIDCGAKYNTFVNDVKVEAKESIALEPGNWIKFGMFESIYRLEAIPLVTTSSGLTTEQKRRIVGNMKHLNSQYINNWNSNCTHLTTAEIMLTVKVLCALIEGKPIVTTAFWNDYVKHVTENLPPPDEKNYRPSCAEVIINSNISLEYMEERKTLFRNKVFIFSSENERKSMEQVIKLAGGKCRSWVNQPISKEDLQDSSVEYLMMQNTDNPTQTESDSFKNMIEHLQILKKRAIPFTELALAVVNCSCEKDCNPNFDRMAAVLANEQTQQTTTKRVLVQGTEEFNTYTSQSSRHDVIPESFSSSVCNMQGFNPKHASTFASKAELECRKNKPGTSGSCTELQTVDTVDSASVKRVGESIETIDLTETKKVKTTKQRDKFDFPSSKRKKEGDITNIFDFFKRKKTTADASEAESEMSGKVNLKKRKMELTDSDESNDQIKKKATKNTPNSQISSAPKPTEKQITDGASSSILDSDSKRGDVSGRRETSQSENRITGSCMLRSEVPLNSNKSGTSGIWLSKNDNNISTKLEGSLKDKEIDEEMLKFINSFKNSVVVVEKDLLRKLCHKNVSAPDVQTLNGTKRNFKVFRKVKPLKEQTTIIPRSNFVRVICNNNSIIEPPMEEKEKDDMEDDIGRPTISGPQRKRRTFNLD